MITHTHTKKATEELAKLQQRADAEQTALEHEWKRLTAIIDHARRQQVGVGVGVYLLVCTSWCA